MSKVILYVNEISPPSRTVLMVAEEIKLEFKIQEVNLNKMEHLSEEFLKMNPLHTIPVLYDHGFIVTDSHAIGCYLIDDFSDCINLYPKNLQKRAVINQCLMFDATILFPPVKRAMPPVLLGKKTSFSKEDIDACKEAFSYLNKLLEGKKWMIEHETYTIADISCVTTASSASILVDMDQYPNVQAWIKRCEQEIPSYNRCNVPGLKKLHALLKSALSSS